MPLNPPTYQGLDVYYSNNVFVNKVPVALWRPPAGAFNDGSPGTATTLGGVTMYGYNESGGKAMYRDEANLMGEGALGDDDGFSPGENFKSSIGSKGSIETFVGSEPTGPNSNPSAPNTPTLKATNLPNTYPRSLTDPVYAQQISKFFRLSHIKMPPENEENLGLSQRDIAGNFVELCLNILDPIYAKFRFNSSPLNSAYRPTWYNRQIGSKDTSEHITGCAADISMGSKEGNIAMFKWIVSSGLPFRQCLIESSSRGSFWIHVSYHRGAKKPGNTRVGWTLNPPGINPGGQNGELLPQWLKS